ncbi:hypothetical protein PR048_007990 [Dryococelus australis]|uniref:Reverse transcriptase domain-containing protein n=1 Tax=Dryococelus australis TaxID=614101 RepID=A0ABQ9HVT6_9NEOP|nr:hypothetical protein PR048_007990 [Dryococelus australis]
MLGSLGCTLTRQKKKTEWRNWRIEEMTTKKRPKCAHYVGQVIKKIGPVEFTVKFLQRKGLSSNFHWPAVQDESEVGICDIATKLPKPISKGTARTSDIFSLPFAFLPLIVL